jgi:hypothetical protein
LNAIRRRNWISYKLRQRRDVALRALIQSIAEERGAVRVLDIGGRVDYWERVGIDFLRAFKAQVTIINLHETELSAVKTYGDVLATAVGNACNLEQFSDKAFDLAHSNSVIEHVETWGNMKAFGVETRRVATSYYVQTPYFWFPIDPHYYKFPLFHWFPRPLRARFLNLFPISYGGRVKTVDAAFEIVDRARLLDLRQFKFLFPDATHRFEWLGLPKSMIAIRR